VRSLEEEIRKARETCDNIVLYEEHKISRATATLNEMRRVRAFFGLSGAEGEEDFGSDEQGMQQVNKPFDVEQAQIFDTPLAQVSDITRPSRHSGEGLIGDRHTQSVGGRHAYTRQGRVSGDEKTMSVTKDDVVAEEPPSAIEAVNLRNDPVQDAAQDDEVHADEAPWRSPSA
jgi:hypothetical protein